jgi:hypothetical protein
MVPGSQVSECDQGNPLPSIDVSVAAEPRSFGVEFVVVALQGPGAYDTHAMDITVVKGASARKSSFGGPLASAKRSSMTASFAPVKVYVLVTVSLCSFAPIGNVWWCLVWHMLICVGQGPGQYAIASEFDKAESKTTRNWFGKSSRDDRPRDAAKLPGTLDSLFRVF